MTEKKLKNHTLICDYGFSVPLDEFILRLQEIAARAKEEGWKDLQFSIDDYGDSATYTAVKGVRPGSSDEP